MTLRCQAVTHDEEKGGWTLCMRQAVVTVYLDTGEVYRLVESRNGTARGLRFCEECLALYQAANGKGVTG